MKTQKQNLELIDMRINLLLNQTEITEDQYEELSILIKLRERINADRQATSIHPSQILNASTGVLAILAILMYEKTGVITSRGFDIAKRFIGA